MMSKAQLNSLNKPQLVEKFLQLQSDFNGICSTVDKLSEKVESLESSLVVSQRVNTLLSSKVTNLERQLHQLEQYSRRECLEFVGIPSTIEQDKLEDKVCEILQNINVDCCETDIEACHRIKNNRTIVKFSSRKKIYQIFKVKKNLRDKDFSGVEGLSKDTNIYINESLCPYYRLLWSKCKDLCNRKIIYRFWSINGILRVKVTETSEPKVILHESDLEEFNGE